jgi:hypothetical protein
MNQLDVLELANWSVTSKLLDDIVNLNILKVSIYVDYKNKILDKFPKNNNFTLLFELDHNDNDLRKTMTKAELIAMALFAKINIEGYN